MTRSDAIDLANQLTERKAEKILDLELLFGSVVMDICKRARFWWRRLDITFTFTQGKTTYDFSTITTTPALTGIAVEEIKVISLILPFGGVSGPIQPITSTLGTVELIPIFDALGYAAMKQNTVQAQPGRYTMGVDDWKTLRIDPPDQTYNVEMTFMAMPMPSSVGDTIASSNVIPLIPPFYHDAVVNGLCARINRRVWGANDSRYLDDKASYEECILRMMMREQFTSNVNKQWTNTDSQAAVQSTAPNSP